MNIDLKRLPKSEVELTVEISADEMEAYLDAASRDLSRQSPIKGFRPGLAPRAAVEREMGSEKVVQAARQLAIKESFVKAVLEQNLETIGQPQVSILETSGQAPFAFKAVVPVVPQIELGNYRAIKIPWVDVKVEPQDVDRTVENLRKSRAQISNVNRPAQKGDRVEIDFTVRLAGAEIEGGQSKQHPLILGQGHFMAGFEDQLVGLKENETKTFSLIAPADYYQKNLAGQKLDFEVKMLLVQEHKLPPLDDDFARSVGQFSDLGNLRQSVSEGLQAEKEMKARDERRAKIAEVLVKDIEIELPEKLIGIELDKMMDELSFSLARMNMDQGSYLNHINKTAPELRDEWQPQAQKRVKIALALRQLAQKENIGVSDEEVEVKLSELLRQAPPLKSNQNIDLAALRDYVRGLIRNEKVFELLESN